MLNPPPRKASRPLPLREALDAVVSKDFAHEAVLDLQPREHAGTGSSDVAVSTSEGRPATLLHPIGVERERSNKLLVAHMTRLDHCPTHSQRNRTAAWEDEQHRAAPTAGKNQPTNSRRPRFHSRTYGPKNACEYSRACFCSRSHELAVKQKSFRTKLIKRNTRSCSDYG